MKSNFVRHKLKKGEASFGTWLTLADPVPARLMARTGFDWLTVEMEHSPVTLENAAQSFAVISAENTVPLVRVASNTSENIKRVLDIGAWGVVVPMVNSKAEAEAAIAAARYLPEGNRSVGGQLHAVSFDTDPATYYEKANNEILVVLMAEHIDAIEDAEEILSLPGIDVIFIGPNDLHKSMGKAPVFDSEDPQFVQAVEHILTTAQKHGVAPGIHVADAAAAEKRKRQGFQFIAIASEAAMMLGKAGEITGHLGLGGTKQIIKY